MARKRVAMGALLPVGFQTITLSNSTAAGLNTTARTGAHVFDFSVETNHVRYRADGTDPTLSTGVLLQKDQVYTWSGYNGTSNLKFQRSTGTATVSVMSWKYE